MSSPWGEWFAAYDAMAHRPGAVGGGALISPYTTNYTTDPLYSSSMVNGQIERGPGQSWKVGYEGWYFQKQIRLALAFARYHTAYNFNSNNAYFDLAYYPPGMLSGLSIRDRIENVVYGHHSGHGGGTTFVYNRFMLQYEF